MQDLIYNQTEIPKDRWRYGLRSSAKVGCGWVATYNALQLMGTRVNIESLIREYERQLPLINGNTGTVFWGPSVLLRKHGFQAKISAKVSQYDALAKDCDTAILFYHWRSGWKIGSHFVALRHTEDGFVGYNTYRTSRGPDSYGESLEAFIKRMGFFGTALTCIRKDPAGQ